ncbi:MAG: hypothetical protein WD401_02680 [Thermomicrobiaceae bacterium]
MTEPGETGAQGKPVTQSRPREWASQLAMMAFLVLAFVAAVAWLANLENQLPDIRTPRDPGSSIVLPGYALMMPGNPDIESVEADLTGDWVTQEIGEMDWLATDLQGSRLRAAFYGTDLYVIARIGPDASRAYVTVDGEPVEHLFRDDLGSYLSLWAGETSDQPILIASNLAHGAHVVEIAAGEDGELAIAGFEIIAATPFQWAFILGYAGLGGGVFMVVRSMLYSINRRNAPSEQQQRSENAALR